MTGRVTTLPSGLRVVTSRMEGVETASLGAWLDVGTRHESPELNGVSHLLEHMAFKGTRRRSAQDIAEQIEAVGGVLNAYTSRENTAYFAKVLKEDVPLALDILADIVQHSVMEPDELARERDVIVQEINQVQDTPDDIIFDHFQQVAYPDQAMGRPVLGSAEKVRGMSREDILAYMGEHYRAPRVVVSAAGRVDHDRLVDAVAEAFAALPAAGAPQTDPLRYVGGAYREARDLEQTHLVLGFDGVAYDDPDYYAAAVYSTLLGGGMSSRLFQEVREKRGLVYNVYSFASSYDDGGLFGVYAGTGPDEVAELMPLLCGELARARDGVSAEEVARARAQLKAGILMALESTSACCEQQARQLMVFGRLIPTSETVEKLDGVDVDAVLRAARRLTAGTPTVAAIGPEGSLPDYDEVAGRLE